MGATPSGIPRGRSNLTRAERRRYFNPYSMNEHLRLCLKMTRRQWEKRECAAIGGVGRSSLVPVRLFCTEVNVDDRTVTLVAG